MANTRDFVVLQSTKLDINYIVETVVSPSCGAVSTFIGTTRDNFKGKKVVKLEYEAYEPMAIKELNALCQKVRVQWNVDKIAIYHRLGEVPVTEASIVIAISSVHRQESLQAVQFTIDTIKASVPIWKKEIYENDDSQWKENKECFWVANDSQLEKINAKEEHKNILKDNHININVNHVEIDFNNICETIEVKSEVKNQSNDFLNGSSDENNQVDIVIDPDQIQIKANAEELNRRIESFILRKREQVNMVNVQEFCTYSSEIQEEDEDRSCVCARVNAMLMKHKDSKSHIKVHRVYNQWRHQNIQQTPPDELHTYPEALEERLSVTEKFLGITKPVPPNIYERIKKMEDRLLLLESISPEYKDFWANDDCDSVKSFDDKLDIKFDMKPIRKRTYSSAELDSKLHELEDRYGKKSR